MKCRVIDRTLPTLAENLALDEALLLDAENGDGGEALRFWEWPTHAVVLGASGRLRDEVDEEACQRDGVPIQRRASGGGTVLLGSGCLLFSLVLDMRREPSLRDIRASYRFISHRLARALEAVALVEQAGTSDLAVNGMKISGSAQQRKSEYLLHHGTLLYDFDIGAMSRYLRMPEKQPDYRAGRTHDAFTTNLSVGIDELTTHIREEWGDSGSVERLPRDLARSLVDSKYQREDWLRRR